LPLVLGTCWNEDVVVCKSGFLIEATFLSRLVSRFFSKDDKYTVSSDDYELNSMIWYDIFVNCSWVNTRWQ